MSDETRVQKFNDDLLIGRNDQDHQDRDRARSLFPALFHVLDDEELRSEFNRYDRKANRYKKRSLGIGIFVVLVVVVALTLTSGEHIYAKCPNGDTIARWAAGVALFFSLMGLLGVMIVPAKTKWLYWRMIGESLRQWHFQVFVCRAEAILASLEGEAQRTDFVKHRQAWLAEFKQRFEGKLTAEFNALLQRQRNAWLHPRPNAPSAAALKALPDEFFDAYGALRIRHQQQYVIWKLRYGQKILPFFSLRAFETLLAYGSVVLTLFLVLDEAVTIWFRDFADFVAQQLPSCMGAAQDPAVQPGQNAGALLLRWVAVFCAVAALGMRTLEDGLQPKRELERYQNYSDDLQDIADRFERGSRAEKFRAMIEVEELAYKEMREFLRTANESRFVM
jgi:hypothetical protein